MSVIKYHVVALLAVTVILLNVQAFVRDEFYLIGALLLLLGPLIVRTLLRFDTQKRLEELRSVERVWGILVLPTLIISGTIFTSFLTAFASFTNAGL